MALGVKLEKMLFGMWSPHKVKLAVSGCPRNCAEQRASVVAGFLDEASRCIDEATKEKCTTAGFRKQCAGSCKVLSLCEDEADPPECRRALRCRELKDDKEECAAKAKAEGCGMGSGSAGYLLRHCYLSCAEHDLAGLLGRFRLHNNLARLPLPLRYLAGCDDGETPTLSAAYAAYVARPADVRVRVSKRFFEKHARDVLGASVDKDGVIWTSSGA